MPTYTSNQPMLSIILIAYNQEATIQQAIISALNQTYHPLEIIISDDASIDRTNEIIRLTLSSYAGPHQIIHNQNEKNLGIGGNISKCVSLSSGELIVIAAGDDISIPVRCERIAATWLASDKKIDLIASDLIDLDASGKTHHLIQPTDLSIYKTPQDWLLHRPHVIGAAQAWSRSLFDHFGPLPKGVVAEDLVMVFRAICRGGCITIREPLVQYRRGGLSGKVRAMTAAEVSRRIISNNQHALVEIPLLRADAEMAGSIDAMRYWLDSEEALAQFIRNIFSEKTYSQRLKLALFTRDVAASKRFRMFIYAACPWILAPAFAIKRIIRK